MIYFFYFGLDSQDFDFLESFKNIERFIRDMATKDEITKEMVIGEVVEKYFAEEIFKVVSDYGLHCIGCHVAAHESIEDGAKAHGLSDEDIKKLVDDLNKARKKLKK